MHEDDVAEIDVGLPGVQRFLPHLGQTDHRLQLGAVTVLQRGEAQLARVAGEDHPRGHPDDIAGLGVDLQVRVGRAQLGQRVGAGHLHRVRIAPLGEQALPLGLANAVLLRNVVGVGRVRGGLGGRIRRTHDVPA